MRKSAIGVVIFFGLFILIGLIALGAGIWNLSRSLGCKSWPTVTGTVTQSQMQSHRSRHGATYSADIGYNYSVAGTNYTGKRLAFGTMSASMAYAQGILKRFPVGKQVPVHYSPSDPAQAVLETSIHGGTWICFGVGTVFVLAGSMFMGFVRRAAATPTQAASTTLRTQRPPVLMGVIFMVMGSFVCVMQGVEGTRNWIGYGAGGFFVIGGLMLLAMRLQNKFLANIMKWAFLLAFLAIFHYVLFFSGTMAVFPFAIFTIIVDLILVASLISWLVKGRRPP